MLLIKDKYHLQVENNYQTDTNLFNTTYIFNGVDADGQHYHIISPTPELTNINNLEIQTTQEHD